MANVFSKVGGLRPGKSVFNLSHRKLFDCDMGQLIPVFHAEVVPGDVFNLANRSIIRMQPLVAPIMHEINVFTHYFFVPYRILMEGWEDFISGGVDGNSNVPLELWSPTNNNKYSLWDYYGLPIGVNPVGREPTNFMRAGYNLIYNEYYRDENLIEEVDLDNEEILHRAWKKDYFTSALPWQQRGTAPALPISGYTKAEWPDTAFYVAGSNITGTGVIGATKIGDISKFATSSEGIKNHLKASLESNVVDFADAATFDVNDLRVAFQVQKWMERNARGGVRYTEFLKSHFGVYPRDDRLQRPEYIGGTRAPVIVSEVLQTSSTDTTSPQGNMAGHGLSANGGFVRRYRAQEYGIIIGLMSIMPKPMYMQGINRQWLRRTKFDFYFPEFAHLSEQAIEMAEIYARENEEDNTETFGFQGRYNEMRYMSDMVAGSMRDTFDYWHLARKFDTPPRLNSSFINCVPSKRIFAVQNVPGFIVDYGNIVKAIRPLPVIAEPGLVDHF